MYWNDRTVTQQQDKKLKKKKKTAILGSLDFN